MHTDDGLAGQGAVFLVMRGRLVFDGAAGALAGARGAGEIVFHVFDPIALTTCLNVAAISLLSISV